MGSFFRYRSQLFSYRRKSGILKIWKKNTLIDDINKYNNSLLFSNNEREFKINSEIKNYLNFIDETSYIKYCAHTSDIIDISWSKKCLNLLISKYFL